MTVPAADSATPWVDATDAFVAWRDDGDPAGLDRLVRLLTPALWQIVRGYGLDRDSAEDTIQSTWLALVRGAGRIREPEAVWRWITLTARREAWRVAGQGRHEQPVEMSTVDDLTPPAAGPEPEVLTGDEARRLWRHVATLPDRCRRLLRIIAFADRPGYATLSAELAMPVGAIGPTRSRCLDKLRRRLDDDPEWSTP
ncbi:sigma-70 family RNA polymerase sigma factor [Dactylosporangium sp. NPDC005572]|uniref:RNA polymerase sigma factor n=1 Tax=Dactylosporangium sp. NPDC005572 TaxID=3156889 RepID=UPI0033B67A48